MFQERRIDNKGDYSKTNVQRTPSPNSPASSGHWGKAGRWETKPHHEMAGDAPFSRCDPHQTITPPSTPSLETSMYCVERTVVPARSEKIIRGKVSKLRRGEWQQEGAEVLVEPVSLPFQGVYLARTLTRFNNDRCWVKAVNASAEEIVLNSNTKIGVIEDIADLPNVPDSSRKRKLLLLADSHGRALQDMLAERLPSDLEVKTKFLPNGKLKHNVSSAKAEISHLTSNDVVILMGGTNDVGKQAPYLLTLHQAFMELPATWKERVVVVSIPDRYDSQLKRELIEANGLLERLVERTIKQDRGDISFCSLGDRLSRDMYTKASLHLNEHGKMALVHLLRSVALEDHEELIARIKHVKISRDEGSAPFETHLEEKLAHLSDSSWKKVKSVLLKYQSSFAYGEGQPLECTSAVTHSINTGINAPVYKKAYRVPFHQKQILDKLITEQLEQGIIKHSYCWFPKNHRMGHQNGDFVWTSGP